MQGYVQIAGAVLLKAWELRIQDIERRGEQGGVIPTEFGELLQAAEELPEHTQFFIPLNHVKSCLGYYNVSCAREML